MEKNSLIGYEESGKVHYVYCRDDSNGKIDEVGEVLKNNYSNIDKVKELISYGSINKICKNIVPSSSTHNFNTPEKNVCIFYGRDKKESEEASVIDEKYYNRKDIFGFFPYRIYLFRNGNWTYLFKDTFLKL